MTNLPPIADPQRLERVVELFEKATDWQRTAADIRLRGRLPGAEIFFNWNGDSAVTGYVKIELRTGPQEHYGFIISNATDPELFARAILVAAYAREEGDRVMAVELDRAIFKARQQA